MLPVQSGSVTICAECTNEASSPLSCLCSSPNLALRQFSQFIVVESVMGKELP